MRKLILTALMAAIAFPGRAPRRNRTANCAATASDIRRSSARTRDAVAAATARDIRERAATCARRGRNIARTGTTATAAGATTTGAASATATAALRPRQLARAVPLQRVPHRRADRADLLRLALLDRRSVALSPAARAG